jgi:beta-ketodecanoyl-[acyl-carrier-protein] synthase
MTAVAITGTGVFTPELVVTNDELVETFNAYADRQNAANADAIAAGEMEPVPHSSSEFIVKASGIENRHVLNKSGILDPEIMHPVLPERTEDELGVMAEMALDAAKKALHQAGRTPADIDAVICAASNHERAYPAIGIEIQEALGIDGFAFDMNVACSSATFGMQAAHDMIANGSARAILVVNPEICSAHLEWRDRDCHFIFGDVCTAAVLERADASDAAGRFEIVSTRCKTVFSNNIRNDNGFLRRTRPGHMEDRRDMLFRQEGRKVFKQVVPMVAELITQHQPLEDGKAGQQQHDGERKARSRPPSPEARPVRRRAAGRSPPAPSKVHQNTRCGTGASTLPPAVIVSITSEPESDEVTKNTITSTIPMSR